MLNNNCLNNYYNLYKLSFTLFSKCNLNCDFCYQRFNRSNDIDINSIKNIPKLLEDNYPEELKNKELDHIDISIKGGELFSDDIDDNMFDIYKNIFNDIIILIRKYLPDIKIKLEWISNGVYTKHDRVLELLNYFTSIKVDQFLGLSYDPIGRFKTKEQFELFEDTFWYFYNKKIPVRLHTIITKSNINSFVNNEVNFLNNNINAPISVNYYTPNSISEQESPSDDDLFNFYKWVIDNNMYQFSPIFTLMDVIITKRFENKICTPDNNIVYYNNKFHKNNKCEIFNKAFDHYFKDCNDEMRYFKSISKRGCLYCEYKDICCEPCWCGTFNKNYNANNCYAKRTIKYLYDYPEIKDRYNEYKNKVVLK